MIDEWNEAIKDLPLPDFITSISFGFHEAQPVLFVAIVHDGISLGSFFEIGDETPYEAFEMAIESAEDAKRFLDSQRGTVH